MLLGSALHDKDSMVSERMLLVMLSPQNVFQSCSFLFGKCFKSGLTFSTFTTIQIVFGRSSLITQRCVPKQRSNMSKLFFISHARIGISYGTLCFSQTEPNIPNLQLRFVQVLLLATFSFIFWHPALPSPLMLSCSLRQRVWVQGVDCRSFRFLTYSPVRISQALQRGSLPFC